MEAAKGTEREGHVQVWKRRRMWAPSWEGPWKLTADVNGGSRGHRAMRGRGGKVSRLTLTGEETDRQRYVIAAGKAEPELGSRGQATNEKSATVECDRRSLDSARPSCGPGAAAADAGEDFKTGGGSD